MKNRWTILVLLFSCSRCWGQADNLHASLEAQAVFISDHDNVPFWMRSDRFGSVPLPGTSASFLAAASKDYSPQAGLVDWGASVLLRADVGSSSRVTLIEGFVKARFSIFQFRAGRIREFTGLVDSTLSSGAFAISGNALGIPKVQLSIPEYWSPPIFGNLFAFKGNFDYGWLGEDSIQYTRYADHSKLYYHQLSFWGRLGKPNWRLKLYGGFTHQVQWGDERSIYGPKFLLTPFKTFQYAVMGKTYLGSKIGNHIGSIDLAMGYDLGNVTVSLYRQNFYDEGALSKLANIADGLNGISLTNKEYRKAESVPDYYPVLGDVNPPFQWHKVVLELFYSKNQAGYPWSKPTNSGDENYYNNFEYYQGWSYKGQGLGNPFVTPAYTTRSGFPNSRGDYFNNNRVMAFYGAIEGSVYNYRFVARGSYSLNYGTFGTSPWGHTTGSPANYTPVPKYNQFKEVNQLSGSLEVTRDLDNGWQAGCMAGLDYGNLFYHSAGLILSIRRGF